jgi:ketosteroid isomerase-like protein
MSEENVKIVRRVVDAWGQGDFALAAQLFDPAIRFETFMPDADEYVTAAGIDELAAFMRDWLAQWRDYRVAGDDFRAIEPDRVFVSVRQIATGKGSGAVVEGPGYCVFRVRDQKVISLVLHYDRAKALEAAGLSE